MSLWSCSASRNSLRLAPLAVLLAGLALACDDDGDPSPADAASTNDAEAPSEACLWELNELLSEVGVSAPTLPDCASTRAEGQLPRDCFIRAAAAGEPAQFTTNVCIDCLIESTFVTLPGDGAFRLYREADYYGDERREVRVDSCTDIVPSLGSELACGGASTLYECSDPLPDPASL